MLYKPIIPLWPSPLSSPLIISSSCGTVMFPLAGSTLFPDVCGFLSHYNCLISSVRSTEPRILSQNHQKFWAAELPILGLLSSSATPSGVLN
jgi:hypothetical protein